MGSDLHGKELGKGITQRKGGMYMARFVNRFGVRESIYNTSLPTLRREQKEAMRLAAEKPALKKEYTLDEWYKQWMSVYKHEVRDSTRLQYSINYEKHISPALGKYSISEITTLEVKRLLNDLKDSELGFEVRNKVRIVLLDMYDMAIVDDFAIKNPVRGLKLVRDEIADPRVLSVEEQSDFFDACKGTFYDELFTVAVLTGLRPGELYALRWEDVDLSAQTINITRTLLYQKLEGDTKKTFHIHPPKTPSSVRTVHYRDPRCTLALKNQFRKKSVIAMRRASSPLEGLEDLLFVTKYNTPLNAVLYSAAIQRVIDLIDESRCELEKFESFSGHCFRHTYATRAFEAGVDAKVVQTQLGHASLKMTMDLYTHLFEGKKLEELAKLTEYSDSVFLASDALAEKRYAAAMHPKVINF